MKARSWNKSVRTLIFLTIFLLIGSRIYPPEAKQNKSRRRKKLFEVPVSFGKTHFIVGVSAEDMQRNRRVKRPINLESISVNEVYFSPDDDLQQKLIQFIQQEQKGVCVAIFSFTDKKIAEQLCQASRNGLLVELVVDPGFLHNRYSKIPLLQEQQIPIYMYDPKSSKNNKGTLSNVMHNKFIVFLQNVDNKPLVWTGSFNFTKSARLSNQENVVILDDPYIVEKYMNQFQELKNRAIRYNAL